MKRFWSLILKDEGKFWLNKILSPLIVCLEEYAIEVNENDFIYFFLRKLISLVEKNILDIDP